MCLFTTLEAVHKVGSIGEPVHNVGSIGVFNESPMQRYIKYSFQDVR